MKKYLLFLLAALMLSWSASAQMVLVFDTNKSDGTTITLPLKGAVNVTVSWGDGSNDTYTAAGNQNHTYAAEGTYTVSINGSLTRFGTNFPNCPNIEKLVKVTSFGDIGLTSLNAAFSGAINLVQLPAQLPSTVRDLMYMFFTNSTFNLDISSWDVSQVTNMSYMFCGAEAFNQNISGWGVSSVTNMNTMFSGAKAFNQNIISWNVSNVTDMSSMFEGATEFNQDISGWNVSKVNNMTRMFSGAKAFNQNISGWNVSDVTNMASMFSGATAFNGNIAEWNVSKVTNMSLMFAYTSFNQNISDWKVSNVTDMGSMFYAAKIFNQDIGRWNVSNVTYMGTMFAEAYAFNQDISDWNVSKATNMWRMFMSATAFNQNIGDWDVTSVTSNMSEMFQNVTLSTSNYNKILIGWAGKIVKNGVNFGGGNSKYSPGEAAAARAVLTGTYNWIITDGGESNIPAVSTVATSSITSTSATSGGDITNDGGSAVTARGVVWNTSAKPTIATNAGKTTDGAGVGTFASSITGLTEFTTYYVRAYATNANGTEYGENREFKTKKELTITGTFTANSKTYDGTAAATINQNSLTLSGIIPELADVSIGSVTLAFNSKDVASDKTVSIASIEFTGTNAPYYSVSLAGAPTSIANITTKGLTVGGTFSVGNKSYDGTTATAITENNLTLITPIAGDDISLINVVAAFGSKAAGKDIPVSITTAALDGADKGNYLLSLTAAPTTTATIDPAKFTITFTVTNENGPLTGATIIINAKTLTTNTSGIATIELENGVYPYSVSGSDYVASNGTITVDGAAIAKSISLIHVGINTNLLSNMNVYPNPFKNELHISNASNVSLVVITNIMGQVVLTVNLNQASDQVVKTNLPSGVYLITVIANNGSKVVRRMIRD